MRIPIRIPIAKSDRYDRNFSQPTLSLKQSHFREQLSKSEGQYNPLQCPCFSQILQELVVSNKGTIKDLVGRIMSN